MENLIVNAKIAKVFDERIHLSQDGEREYYSAKALIFKEVTSPSGNIIKRNCVASIDEKSVIDRLKSLPEGTPISVTINPFAAYEWQGKMIGKIIIKAVQTPQAQPMQTPQAQPMQTPQAQPMQTPQAQPMQTPQAQPMQTPQAQPMQTPQAQPMQTPQAQPRIDADDLPF